MAALSAIQGAVVRFLYPLGLLDPPVDTLAKSDTFAERLAYLDERGYLIVPERADGRRHTGSFGPPTLTTRPSPTLLRRRIPNGSPTA